jgi:ribonuclease Z
MIMRLAIDGGRLPIPVHYPRGGETWFEHLRHASAGQERVPVAGHPEDPGIVRTGAAFSLLAARLEHRVETLGWRVQEPDGRRMLPERLAARGIAGPDIGRLQAAGRLSVGGRTVQIDEVSEHRPGQSFAFVMDTRWCDGALQLAAGADLLVCESTFLSADEELAASYGHLTARQAGRLAAVAGARRLVLTHFSRRYPDVAAFAEEAGAEFGDVVVAGDLDRIAVPPRR